MTTMKKTMITLMAAALFTAAIPAMAAEHEHGAMHSQQDADCARECDLLLRNCAQEVDSIQERIQKIKKAIDANGAKPENLEELRILNKKLKEANETLRALTKPGH
jgi:peptidoglycan hydrolase CwlO-like protein